MVAGVCGGIAEYFEMDPTVVRLIAVLLTIIGNAAAVLAYVVIWVAVPEAPESSTSAGEVAPEDPASTASPRAAAATVVVEAEEPVAPTPQATYSQAPPPARKATHGRGTMLFGLALVILGLVFIAETFLPGFNVWQYWPLILVGLGLRMVITGKGG